MELKRAAELVICDLLKEAISDLTFLPHKGGGNDLTPDWQSNYEYKLGDILRPTNHSLLHAVVINVPGNSGSTQPLFTDTVGEIFNGLPVYETIPPYAISKLIDSGTPLPPFASIQIEGERKFHSNETSFLTGILRWITRADSSNVVQHSLDFKRIYDAMGNIGNGYDYLRKMIVHGVDITSTEDYVDEARQAHGDIIHFTMGVT